MGDFIVNAKDSIHFRIGGDSQKWFAPKYTHQIFDEKEQIKGYEGLSVEMTLSPKYLVPLVQIHFTKKAPSFALNIDNIEEKLRDHFGKIYTDPVQFQIEVLDKEAQEPKYGKKVTEIVGKTGKFDLHKIPVGEKDFKDKQFYLQAILTFFIDGASQIDINEFWNYFILYD